MAAFTSRLSNEEVEMQTAFDVAIVGAGIVGLAHAFAAVRRGKRVLVIDRDAQANGASIRNFGFITVTGQQAGECWRRARLSRDVWAEVAPQAGIDIIHNGLMVPVRRDEAVAILEAFVRTEMGAACEMLTPQAAKARVPHLNSSLKAALWSPHELRVESRTAIPKLAAWLEAAHGVSIVRGALVREIAYPKVMTTSGAYQAEAVIVCPGDDFLSLYPERIAAYQPTKCLLHMLRVDPGAGVRLGAAAMSDLGLIRYLGYAELPEAAALKRVLQEEQPGALANGVHLIVVQSADGSLVVGDSHHYADTPPPFAPQAVDQTILDEFRAVLDLPEARVTERWTGVYSSCSDRLMFLDAPEPGVRIVMVTSGTGASTAFAIAEEVIGDIYG
ncbi:MAG: TIGR03364 family FAD-dependent oxidoreductase [Hyphomicrobiales bacterium]|nr:TIGR03364 family FAD-dependent oxidoreductase [Hyphomicrobiales bacterium]